MKGQHHNHSHVHSHAHATGNIATAFALNTVFALIELVGGLLTNSVAILSDAVHDLGDSLSLGTAWYFEKESKKGRSKLFNYGYYRFSLMGAFINCANEIELLQLPNCDFLVDDIVLRHQDPHLGQLHLFLCLETDCLS